MFHHLKTTLAIAALCVSFTQVAQASSCKEGDSLYPCGLEFTTIPTLPTLAQGVSTTVGPYVLTNKGGASVTLNSVVLAKQLDDVAAGQVTFAAGTTCVAALTLATTATCNIYLDLIPTDPGLLNWDLTVTPQSTQRPLVLDITTTAQPVNYLTGAYVVNSAISEGGTSSISHCPLGPYGLFSNDCTAVTLNFASPTSLNNARNIVLNSFNSMAYISNSGNGNGDNITICPIIDEENFGSGAGYCVNSASVFGGPMGLTFNADGSLLYVANSTDPSSPGSPGGGISKCPVNLDGSLGSCSFLNVGEATNGIAFNDTYTYAYVTVPGSATIKIYTVDGSGNLTFDTNATFDFGTLPALAPSAIQNAFGALIFTNPTPAAVDNSLSTCLNSDNVFSGCDSPVDNTASTKLAKPAGFDVHEFIPGPGLLISNLDKISGNFVVTSCGDPDIETCVPMTDSTFNSPSDVLILGISEPGPRSINLRK